MELVENVSMVGFPGAPYSDAVLQAAAESVRADCGWHIAPVEAATVEVAVAGGVALLPSLQVVEVTAVRTAVSQTVLTGWRVDKGSGVLFGLGSVSRVEVDYTHGYPDCPPALKPVIAERARAMAAGGYVRQESLGARSVTLAGFEGGGTSDALSRYRLPPRP